MDQPANLNKFQHPDFTAKGEDRAWVDLTSLETLWFNTGSLCNLECQGCYMESSPTNDRLAYMPHDEVVRYLDEIEELNWAVREIGFTGGEPFMNPQMIEILHSCLNRGYEVLVLTNAMKPLEHHQDSLLKLKDQFGPQLKFRVSIDHHQADQHDKLRGAGSWPVMIKGLRWLHDHGFSLAVAGRTLWHEPEDAARAGYGEMLQENGIGLDVADPGQLVLFPEMDETVEVPEITTACWGILGVHPDQMMCATSRMVVLKKGQSRAQVVPCTLLPYDARFVMGDVLRSAQKSVKLNHPHCAKFCVLGGGSCSAA